MKTKVKIVLLGTGYPKPHPDRSGPALAVIVNDRAFILDAGPGVVRRIQGAFDNGIKELAQTNIDTLILTHLHSDHTLGLPDIIFTPWVMRREKKLAIYGPPGTKHMVKHITAAYKEDIFVRTHGLEDGNLTGYKTQVTEIESGIFYRDEQVQIKAFKVKHGIWKHAFGLTFLIGDKKIVISGDTKPHPDVVREAKGADVLIHEVVSDTSYDDVDPRWKKYLKTFHTSSTELAAIAKKAKAKKLILIHQIHPKISKRKLVAEIKQGYSGKVIYGNDLDVFVV